jgi:hypothetical protein
LNEIYLAVTLESTVAWPKREYGKRNSDLVAVGKCLARSPDMKVNNIENVSRVLCELRLMSGAEVRRLEGWGL